MMSSQGFFNIIGSLDEFNKGVVWKELCSIGVGVSNGLRCLSISVMSLAGFTLTYSWWLLLLSLFFF